MRASDELFKMLVIKLELVIKIKTRENMETGAYAQEVKAGGGMRGQAEKEMDGWAKRLKRKQSRMKMEKKREI